MLVGVVFLYDAEEAIPVSNGFVLHQIKLIGERPPDIAIGGQPGHDVAYIALIRLCIHRGKAPPVVGVEENDIGFNTQGHQVCYPLFEMPEKYGIESGKVELPTTSCFSRTIWSGFHVLEPRDRHG